MRNHIKRITSFGRSIPGIIFRNPLVVLLFRTLRDRKTSEPVFLTKFDLISEGFELHMAHLVHLVNLVHLVH